MSKVAADTLKSLASTQDLIIGATGQTVTLPGNELRVNTFKDKGGNTLWTSDGSGTLSSVNSGLKGALTLLSTQTASDSASISFTTQLTSTYDLYIFTFINVNPVTDNTNLMINGSTDGGSNYNANKTTSTFGAFHGEGGGTTFQYLAGSDVNNSTAFQKCTGDIGNGADEGSSGEVYLFAPSSTTYAKHFWNRSQEYGAGNQAGDWLMAGYFNTTSAIDAIQFKISTGNIANGIFKLYGL